MSNSYAEEAAAWLRFTEKGYLKKYGQIPLDARMEIARGYIELARIEGAQRTPECTHEAFEEYGAGRRCADCRQNIS